MAIALEEKILQYGESQATKLAIGYKDEAVTYGDLKYKILRACSFLSKNGVKKNNIVLLQALAGSDYISVYLALHCLGAIVVPVDRKAIAETVLGMQRQLDTKFIIGTEKFVAGMKRGMTYTMLHEEKEVFEYKSSVYNQDDMYDILFTTGTTGQSKGVIITRKSVLAAIRNEIEGAEMIPDEVLLIPIPLNHSFGIGKLRAALYMGATVVLQNGVSMVAELKNNINKFNCTAMICVPSALQIISRQAGNRLGEILGNLHFIETASAPFGVDLKQILLKLLPDVHILNRYGSTETPAVVYLDIMKSPDKLESIGKALSDVRVKIVDDFRQEIDSSREQIGKLAISGPMIMRGYYKDEKLTESVLVDGWLYSRDMAYIDEEGYIFLMGRDDDVINTGGKKFSPIEVEEILMKSGLVKECAVVGITDTEGLLGMIPALVYVPLDQPEVEENEIIRYLKEHTEKYKQPVVWKMVKQIPRNYMGKLERRKVKEMFINCSQ